MEKGNIVSIEERIPKLKQIRKKKANKRLIMLLSFFFLLIGAVVYLQSPLSHIKDIRIQGNKYIASPQIEALSGLSKGDNIWEVDKEQVWRSLKRDPQIKSAKVSLAFPNHINIQVEEYRRIGYLSKESRYYPIIQSGELLKPLKKGDLPDYAPILVDFSKGDALSQLVLELSKLPPEILNSVSEIYNDPKKTDPYHLVIFMNDGFEVSATSRSLSDKLIHYPSIISQLNPKVKGVIDLEVGSYFKAYEKGNNGSRKGTDGKGNE
ncbi:cell division protein FtsQ/DivIB [Peribacillus deserti]|uniref:Cell division protein DivIB n=1 Tax=Peribacillus deserti TaxID=673318 RepID=A0A2N5M171_9BACI|nr:FtsQ-type POTRA domain-containing protein [Peribacillus deserti]PLT28101.1 cell division protein FtsQ [Peribacillus deserti]